MKLLIYGGGAVGLGIASCLIKSGHDVTIISRPDTVASLTQKGLERIGIFGKFHAPPGSFHTFSTLAEVAREKFSYILVCTKAHDSEGAAKDLASHQSVLGKEGKIVLLQNGWGGAEQFAGFFDKERVLSARVITGFTRPELHRVEVTVHADAISVGSLFTTDPPNLGALCEAIEEGGIPCTQVNDVEKKLWAKMLYNCALNALGAIFEVPYGVLGDHESTRAIMESVVKEVYAVMEVSGYETHVATPGEYLEIFYGALLPPTADHDSSMLQDIRQKKTTEIDFLNGAVVKLGKQMGVETPVNLTIVRMIKFLEDRP